MRMRIMPTKQSPPPTAAGSHMCEGQQTQARSVVCQQPDAGPLIVYLSLARNATSNYKACQGNLDGQEVLVLLCRWTAQPALALHLQENGQLCGYLSRCRVNTRFNTRADRCHQQCASKAADMQAPPRQQPTALRRLHCRSSGSSSTPGAEHTVVTPALPRRVSSLLVRHARRLWYNSQPV